MAYYQLSKSGAQIDAALDLAVNAAQKNGSYDTLTSGKAKNLQGRPSDAVDAEFYHRTAGGSADIGSGGATIKSIHGKTLVWNQLCQNGNFADTSVWELFNSTLSVSDNVATVLATDSYGMIRQYVNVVSGHKYLIRFDSKGTSQKTVYYGINGGGFINHNHSYTIKTSWQTVSRIWSMTASSSAQLRYFMDATSDFDTVYIRNAQFFDLTDIFGAGNEPTADAFKLLFPLDYYAYNAGSLLNFNGTGLKTVGFNQWDEQFEVIGSNIYNKNAIRVISGATYYFKIGSSNFSTIRAVDENNVSLGGIAYSIANGTVTIPANVRYIGFTLNSAYGTTYNNDICINLSWSGWRNGEYEAYWDSTLALPVSTYFPTGMKSAGTAYDELTEKKAIQRIGIRAYESGDESDPSVVTDGTNTCYVLTTPVETDIDISLNYKVDDFGTEELLPENEATPTTSPFVASILYAMNAVDTIRNMPDKVYRAFVDIKDSNDVHHTFSVVVGAIPSIDTANTKLVGIPAGVYRAVKGSEHEYSDVEVDSNGNVYIDGTLDSFDSASTVTTEKYF